MSLIDLQVESRQEALRRNPLVGALAASESIDDLRAVASQLGLWVIAFQDILRLNTARVTDPRLLAIAEVHLVEDAGHQLWFLDDTEYLLGRVPDLRGAFSTDQAGLREATYRLTSFVFSAESDLERITLVKALEGAGHVFFDTVADLADRVQAGEQLQYFSRTHYDVELEHELHDLETTALLGNHLSSAKRIHGALLLVDGVFEAFDHMFRSLAQGLARGSTERLEPSVSGVG